MTKVEHIYDVPRAPTRIHKNRIPHTVEWGSLISESADPYYDAQLNRCIFDQQQWESRKLIQAAEYRCRFGEDWPF